MNDISPKTARKIQTLQKIAADLRDGKDFNITRLTILKGFCEDSETAAQFASFPCKEVPQGDEGN
jgi:hypothetical protein